ncbi:MAG: hypothetical protein U0S12_12680 [Fimbriimonadales bacterium]
MHRVRGQRPRGFDQRIDALVVHDSPEKSERKPLNAQLAAHVLAGPNRLKIRHPRVDRAHPLGRHPALHQHLGDGVRDADKVGEKPGVALHLRGRPRQHHVARQNAARLLGQLGGERRHDIVGAEVGVDHVETVPPQESHVAGKGVEAELAFQRKLDLLNADQAFVKRGPWRNSRPHLVATLGKRPAQIDEVAFDSAPVVQGTPDLKDPHRLLARAEATPEGGARPVNSSLWTSP